MPSHDPALALRSSLVRGCGALLRELPEDLGIVGALDLKDADQPALDPRQDMIDQQI